MPPALFVASTCQQVRLSFLIKAEVPIRAGPSSPRRTYCLRRCRVFRSSGYLFVCPRAQGGEKDSCLLKNTLCQVLYYNLFHRSLPKAVHGVM